jgi:hypothetical protein
MALHEFDEWQVDLIFHTAAETSAAHSHAPNLRGLVEPLFSLMHDDSILFNDSLHVSGLDHQLPSHLNGTQPTSQGSDGLERGGGQRCRKTIHRKPFDRGKRVWLTNARRSPYDRCCVDLGNPPLPRVIIRMVHGAYPSIKPDRYTEFFADLADDGIFHAFARLDLSTWKPPVVRFGASLSLDQKYLRFGYDCRATARAWNSLRHPLDLVTHGGPDFRIHGS